MNLFLLILLHNIQKQAKICLIIKYLPLKIDFYYKIHKLCDFSLQIK